MNANISDEPSHAAALVAGFLRLLWNLIRAPLVVLLVLIEPLVSIVLSLAALVGLVTAILYRFGTPNDRFPFWGMIGASIACAFALCGYRGLIRLLSPRGNRY